MSLINEGDSFPAQLWAVTRLLLARNGRMDASIARHLLTPDTLPTGEKENADFTEAVNTLADLGLLTVTEDVIELAAATRRLSPNDVTGFNALLREAALDPTRNLGIADQTASGKPDLSGPKDLIRALAWFLTLNPFDSLDLEAVQRSQRGVFPDHLPLPFTNDVRWNRFTYWGPTLGFVARALLVPEKETAARLVPDCTSAVRETVAGLWKDGERVGATEAITRIREKLPVLPGGTYSRTLGLASPQGGVVCASLSNALLTGEEQGWLTFRRQADAADDILLTDLRGTRRVTEFTITRGV